LEGKGVLLEALTVFGNGSALSGIVFAASTVFIIERKLWAAAGFATAGAVFTFFGMMHGETVGITAHPELAASYLLVAAFLAACAKLAPVAPLPPARVHQHEAAPAGAA
jgi:AGZA family xanthine/uracil permease-like MFS transporter